ncbi:hypothetical protein THSYN_16190 [Candidatus Thiodictyon syntrophicum]|uniref:Antitoxin n=2 Tax=Candidatus Thiodictyon syntrophicum TaxID=1166950 RepID=A0A2K8UGT0_9GAMM|nr:hypothetical protein THSYN_16190 [Candidatus Thiodictyon syntrophicum]
MQVSVTEAKGQLPDLVRRADAGDEVILTRNGHATVRLVPIKTAPDKKTRRTLLEALRASASPTAGPSVARSQDFLYGDDGLGLEVVPVTATSARRIARAYERWGKGINPAALNFGDCFAY